MRSAIIDIGSNAVRSVVYENQTFGSPEIYNDKFKTNLGVFLDLKDIDIPHPIYSIFSYFTQIFKKLDVTSVKCVATAVLRRHGNVQIFINLVKKKFNIDIEVISGEKEAYLTAVGLLTGIPEASGVVVDLGGGSLEIAEVANKKIGKVCSTHWEQDY